MSDDLLQAYMDPFYNECRAYGRLEEANLNGKVAVRCHGYMTFPAEYEEELVRGYPTAVALLQSDMVSHHRLKVLP